MTALHSSELGKRFGKRWALEGCSFEVPAGSVAALVGPNGSGKTTLLHLAAGLLTPTAGSVRVFDADPGTDVSLLPRIGLVAQEMPLYRNFTVAETLTLGRKLNPRWDQDRVTERLDQLAIPLTQKVGTLSGGQRAQVALAVALGKRPELLLLDEPLASLDPLARREFMQTLMQTAAEGDLTIVLSSHLIADLERVCDHLVLLAAGHTQLAGSIESLLATHRVIIGPRPSRPVAGVADIVDEVRDARGTTMIARVDGPILDPAFVVEDVGLEELVLAYLSQSRDASRLDRPHPVPATGVAS